MINNLKKTAAAFLLGGAVLIACGRSSDTATVPGSTTGTGTGTTASATGDIWITKADQTMKLSQQVGALKFTSTGNINPNIVINENLAFQAVDGFGFALTDGSAQLINKMSATARAQLLQELFGNSANSIGVSALRISIGASDLSANVYSYDDLPTGQTDLSLDKFDLSGSADVIKLLKEIVAINPNIMVMATPWSAPLWMKDNASSMGGSLQPQYYAIYAQYFVKYIKAMQAQGITIHAITPQNEPLYGGNNPSMVMNADQQNAFVRDYLGPAFRSAGLSTKIIAYDHNADNIQYATTLYADANTNPYVDGAAFHLYGGDINALGTLHNSYPGKNIYFTEMWTGSNGNFTDDFKWHMKNVLLGSLNNWSKTVIEWNLANDSSFGPHTPGGCTMCQGALTMSGGDAFTRNVSYYIIAQASKFVPKNSVRISSSSVAGLNNVAFKTPAGKIVVIVMNEGSSAVVFNLSYNGKIAATSLDAGSAATYVF